MILIIAEKPSLARNIVAGIGKMTRKDGYFENNGLLSNLGIWTFVYFRCIEDYSNADNY